MSRGVRKEKNLPFGKRKSNGIVECQAQGLVDLVIRETDGIVIV